MKSLLLRDANVIWQLLRGQPRQGTHKDRLQRFYAPQAEHYDQFRERLLFGRERLLDQLCLEPGQRVVDLGCGTARNLEFIAPAVLGALDIFYAVDLCPVLVQRARIRCAGMPRVQVIEDDATTFNPGEPVDRVYFSYALTMIPDWRGALRNAYRMLKPGGLIGVVDFHLTTLPARDSTPRREPLQDRFWRQWFAHDGVYLEPAHRFYLNGQFEPVLQFCAKSPVPYVPLLKVPYYIFVGRK